MGGDLNGDGHCDLAMGEYVWEGGAYVAYGPLTASGSIGRHLGAYIDGFPGFGWFGPEVSADGDVNDDGYDDLLVGTYSGTHGGESRGVTYLFYGPISGILEGSDADAFMVGEVEDDYAGYAIDLPGDLNMDGFGDVLIGAPQRSVSQTTDGAAYVVFGPISGSVSLADADVRMVGSDVEDEAGQDLAGVGDVDGDGRPDLLISAEGDASYQAATYLLLGSGF